MKLLLLLLLTVCECGSSIITREAGQNVTLLCTYNVQYYKTLSVCWNRGEIPSRGCDQQLVATDGRSVQEHTRVSARYQLLGPLDRGDVSLTIVNLSKNDSGRYGCRVDIPGWFNDDKHHFDLTIAPRMTTLPPSPSSSPSPSPSSSWGTELATATPTGQVTSTGTSLTPSSDGVSGAQEDGVLTVVLVSVVLVVVFVVTLGGLLFIAQRRRRLNKLRLQQQVGGSVGFFVSSSTLQLHRRGSAIENIYQIDSSEYEYCP